MLLILEEIEEPALPVAVAASLERLASSEPAELYTELAAASAELMAEPACEVTDSKPLVTDEMTGPAPPVTVLATPERAEDASLIPLLTTERIEEASCAAPKPAAATRRTGVETFMVVLEEFWGVIW